MKVFIFFAFVALQVLLVKSHHFVAVCNLVGTANNPGLSGTVVFTQDDENSNVTMHIEARNISNPDAEHGVHVHQFGDIRLTSGSSVGGHWDPTSVDHGCPDDDVRHYGDTGNWEVSANGTISAEKELDLLTLNGPNSIIGRAVVFHELQDNCVTVASSGSRLGFCVIGVANPTLHEETSNPAANGSPDVTTAVCNLSPIDNSGISGIVYFSQTGNSTTVSARVEGITGKHGFHIHQFGDLTDAMSVGGHYNPGNNTHSIPSYSTNIHVGDMGNIYYYSNSVAFYQYTFDNIKLNGENNVIGRTVVVHQDEDKCTVPSSGGRRAFCVIGIAGTETTLADLQLPNDVPTTQDTSACDPEPTTGTNTETEPTTGASNTISASVSALFFTLLVALTFV